MDEVSRKRARVTLHRHAYAMASDSELAAMDKEFHDDWALLQADLMLGNYADPDSIQSQIHYTEWHIKAITAEIERRWMARIRRPEGQSPSQWTGRFDAMRRTSIVEGLGLLGLELVKRGKEYKASCPFHDDDTPSLSVNESKNLWVCYSCHRGGDLVRYVELLYGKSSTEALAYLEMILHSIDSGSLDRPSDAA